MFVRTAAANFLLNFYDFEVWKRFWCVTIINPVTGEETVIENDAAQLINHYKAHKHEIYVGFNNRQYDDWIFKGIIKGFDPWDINEWIIKKQRKGWEFSSLLLKVKLNTFDTMIGFNGLKTLEAFMGVNIKETDIPFDYDGEFTEAMIADALFYNKQDVLNTIRVFMERKSEFDSYMGLLKLFNLPLSYLSRSKAQLAAVILGAKKHKWKDEFDISIPPTLKITKYTQVIDYFKNDWNYDTNLEIELAGVPHTLGTGGIHGAIPKYFGVGNYLHIDATSYYPTLMIVYSQWCMSRSGASVEKFKKIYDSRIEFKKQKDPRANALKIVINAAYGAMKDKFNALYDPRSANNVCIFGQLLLVDLIERLELETDSELIQSNTDGLIFKINGDEEKVIKVCEEWEIRTGIKLGFDKIIKICQKDVNNYIVVFGNGKVEAKGAYVKDLNNLDYDLAIVNKAIRKNLLENIPVEETILNCDDFRMFQKVVKLSNKYQWVEHERLNAINTKHDNKAYRVFASTNPDDGRLLKCKLTEKGVKKDKFGNTPDKCFIFNDDLTDVKIPKTLDKQYYINLAKKRLEDFGV